MAVGVTREAKLTGPLFHLFTCRAPVPVKPPGHTKSCLNKAFTQQGHFTGKAICQR